MKSLLLASLGIPVLQLIADQVIRALWITKGGSKWNLGLFLVGVFCSWGVGFALLLTVQLVGKFSRASAKGLTVLLALCTSSFLVANVFLFQFFGEYLFPGAIAFVTEDYHYLLDYLKNFLSISSFLIFIFLVLFHYFCLRPRSEIPGTWKLLSVLVPVLGTVSFALNRTEKLSEYRFPPDVVMVQSLSKHFLRVHEKVWPLRPSNRVSSYAGEKAIRPKTVLFIINESMGIRGVTFLNDYKPACNGCLGTTRIKQQMQSDSTSFVAFQSGYTSSLATQVSMPSIFSGVSPEQSHRILHHVPLLWDMAKAAGYRTGYFTSQRIRWASLNDFLLQEPIDTLVSNESTDHPIANDMGIDDFYTVESIEAWLKAHPQENLFLLWNTNALHAPFQEKSDFIDLSSVPGTRYDKALEVVDSATAKIFQSLKNLQRWDDALIISTGDHGENPAPQHATARIKSHFEEMIRLPIWIKIPQSLQNHEMVNMLRLNQTKIVSNIDLAPTLAHIWDIRVSEKLPISGQSLGKPISDKRVLVVLSTNDTRSWDGEGFGLIYQDYRYVLTPKNQRALYYLPNDPLQKQSILDAAPDSVMKPLREVIASNPWLSRIHNHYLK